MNYCPLNITVPTNAIPISAGLYNMTALSTNTFQCQAGFGCDPNGLPTFTCETGTQTGGYWSGPFGSCPRMCLMLH